MTDKSDLDAARYEFHRTIMNSYDALISDEDDRELRQLQRCLFEADVLAIISESSKQNCDPNFFPKEEIIKITRESKKQNREQYKEFFKIEILKESSKDLAGFVTNVESFNKFISIAKKLGKMYVHVLVKEFFFYKLFLLDLFYDYYFDYKNQIMPLLHKDIFYWALGKKSFKSLVGSWQYFLSEIKGHYIMYEYSRTNIFSAYLEIEDEEDDLRFELSFSFEFVTQHFHPSLRSDKLTDIGEIEDFLFDEFIAFDKLFAGLHKNYISIDRIFNYNRDSLGSDPREKAPEESLKLGASGDA